MKRIVVKIAAFIAVIALSVAMVSCSGVYSSYSATVLVRSNSPDHVHVSFASMKGRLVNKLDHTGDQDGAMMCTASLEEGEMRVYYIANGSDTEQELFTLRGGESINAERLGYLTNGQDAKIVIVTGDEGAKGGKITIDVVR